jgi:hypothetical protein
LYRVDDPPNPPITHVNALRRSLYLQAAVWAVAGAALACVPRFVVFTVLHYPGTIEPLWLRLLGLQAFGLALLMVLVAHRAEELWWWSWAFALATVGSAAAAVLHAAFGVAPGQSRGPTWAMAAVLAAFSLSLLYGLYATARRYEPR